MCFRAVNRPIVLLTALVSLLSSPIARGQALRFCPGDDFPFAFNPITGECDAAGSFDPNVCAEEPCIELLHNIFEPLVSTSNDQVLEPQLATGWEQLDEVTFRFTLRRGVTFHNGEPFDAEAVRFSLMRASQAWGATAWFPEITEVGVVDPYTVDVVLKKPDSLFLYRLGHIGLIQPARYFRQVGVARFGEKPVGTGAFRLAGSDKQQNEIRLEANPSYWRKGYPKIQHLIYAYMDSDRALELLINGQLDLIRRLNPRRTTQFMQTGRGKVVKAWLPSLILGQFNLLKPQTPLRNHKVRRAINLAIHRDHLIRFGAIGNGRLLGGYTVPEDPNHVELEPYPFDVPKARRLLQEANYSEGFPLSIAVDPQVPPKIENIIAVCLRRIGIAAECHRAGASEFHKELFLSKLSGKFPPSYDLLLISLPMGTIFHSGMVPMTSLYSREPNESALRDLYLDQVYEEALSTYDPAKASVLWKRLERYVYENHLLLIGYQDKAVFGARRGLHFTPRILMSFWDAYYEE
jgi:peptide/nickel transport system substrate-binding protein